VIDRDGAWAILTEFTASESLRKHALAVESAMCAYAEREGADAEFGASRACSTTSTEMHPTAPRHP
jgi:predicted hydrolase (HD superfamily)